MTRRSLTLYPILETAVRRFQAKLLTSLDKDITFTEAVNLLILGGWLGGGIDWIEKLGADSIKSLLQHADLSVESIGDDLVDRLLKEAAKPSQLKNTA